MILIILSAATFNAIISSYCIHKFTINRTRNLTACSHILCGTLVQNIKLENRQNPKNEGGGNK